MSTKLLTRAFEFDQMDDRVLFTSAPFIRYMENVLESMTGCKLYKLIVAWEPEGKHLGYTDGRTVYVNAGHPYCRHYKKQRQRFLFVLAILFHEIGHLLDADLTKDYMKTLKRISEMTAFCKLPDSLTDDEEELLNAMQNPALLPIFKEISKAAYNIGLDAHDETAMANNFSSYVEQCFAISLQVHMAKATTLQQRRSRNVMEISNLISLMFQYIRFGKYVMDDTEESWNDPAVVLIESCKDFMDDLRYSDEQEVRQLALFHLLGTLWPYLRDRLDYPDPNELPPMSAPQDASGSDGSDGNSQGNQSGGSDGSDGDSESKQSGGSDGSDGDSKSNQSGGSDGSDGNSESKQSGGSDGSDGESKSNQTGGSDGSDGDSESNQTGGSDGSDGNSQGNQTGGSAGAPSDEDGSKDDEGQSNKSGSGSGKSSNGDNADVGNSSSGLQSGGGNATSGGNDKSAGNKASGSGDSDGNETESMSAGSADSDEEAEKDDKNSSGHERNETPGTTKSSALESRGPESEKGNNKKDSNAGNKDWLPDPEKLKKLLGEIQEVSKQFREDSPKNVDGKSIKVGNDRRPIRKTAVGEQAAESLTRAISTAMTAEIMANNNNSDIRNETEENIGEIIINQDANSPHKNIPVDIVRPRCTLDAVKKSYNIIFSKVEGYANRAAQEVKQMFEEIREGEVLRCRRSGRVDSRGLHRINTNQRIFFTKKAPSDEDDMAICLLIDQSLSMADINKGMEQSKIAYARETAVMLEAFARKAGIPLFICGHNMGLGRMNFYVHKAFDSTSEIDRCALSALTTSGRNRDGYAILIATEMLAKRTESDKLFIMLSDGLPNDSSYGGDAAAKDIRSIVSLAKRKYGIETLACAIGSDKDRIKAIYGSSYLDVSDLAALPKTLTRLIRERIE